MPRSLASDAADSSSSMPLAAKRSVSTADPSFPDAACNLPRYMAATFFRGPALISIACRKAHPLPPYRRCAQRVGRVRSLLQRHVARGACRHMRPDCTRRISVATADRGKSHRQGFFGAQEVGESRPETVGYWSAALFDVLHDVVDHPDLFGSTGVTVQQCGGAVINSSGPPQGGLVVTFSELAQRLKSAYIWMHQLHEFWNADRSRKASATPVDGSEHQRIANGLASCPALNLSSS